MDLFIILGALIGLVMLGRPHMCKEVGKAHHQAVGMSLELQCPPCEKIHCTPKKSKRLRCKGGVTRGICNCCPVCAKVKGESCGGAWNYLGKCDRGLLCQPNPHQRPSEQQNKPEGKCTKASSDKLNEVMDQAMPAYCKPRCTSTYCRAHPRAICSAIDNAEQKRSCQGDCQHTSCGACRFVKDQPECLKCPKDDFKCLRKFARCVKKEYCSRDKLPCKRSGDDERGAKFKCFVPECVSP